jgi:hypothetical protein
MISTNNLKKLIKNIIFYDIISKYNLENVHQVPILKNIKISIFFKNFESGLVKKVLTSLFFYRNLLNKQGCIEKINFGYKNKSKNVNFTVFLTLRRKIMYEFYSYIYFILIPNIKKKRFIYKENLVFNKLFFKIYDLKSFYNLNENLLKINFVVKIQLEYNGYFKKIIKKLNKLFMNF